MKIMQNIEVSLTILSNEHSKGFTETENVSFYPDIVLKVVESPFHL